MYAPTTETVGESFLWYRPNPRLQIGAALLWKQGAFRGLANYELIPETATTPNLRVGLGLQGIGTGNPGYFATSEKNLLLPEGVLNAYLGVGFRANEDHAHLLGGIKFTPTGGRITLGIQNDGHQSHPFATYTLGKGWSTGVYLIGFKSPAFMLGFSY